MTLLVLVLIALVTVVVAGLIELRMDRVSRDEEDRSGPPRSAP
jgi:hypothetical protein